MESIEIGTLDLRYENCRIKNPAAEKILLNSICEGGIQEPLQGVQAQGGRVLLDGFKRYRCARKLGLAVVPYSSIGTDAALAIVRILRIGNAHHLNILEQARFIEELRSAHKMCVSEIAKVLGRSKGWVSMRCGLILQISEPILGKIFAGEFPAYAFMYTLRRFMRMNSVESREIEAFVASVAGKGLTLREIELLAQGYFKGETYFRQQIASGDVIWALNRMKESLPGAKECSEFERSVLRDLEIASKAIQRITCKTDDPRLKSNAFHAQANLLTARILKQTDRFIETLRYLYDQSGQA